MTKQDRQIWEAVIKRQEERVRQGKKTAKEYDQVVADCDSLIELITNLQNDVKRLEKIKR